MFRLDNLLEQWASIYQPMQHNPAAKAAAEEKAFFRIDRLELENGFSRVFNLLKKPCLCHCVNFDARLDDRDPHFALYHHQLYICQKQAGDPNFMADELSAAETKYSLNEMTLDLLAFLFALSDAVAGKQLPRDAPDSLRRLLASLTKEDRDGLRGMRLEDTEWWSTPRYKNGWWIMGIEIYGLDTRPICIVPGRYV